MNHYGAFFNYVEKFTRNLFLFCDCNLYDLQNYVFNIYCLGIII